jgi:hypothetical protein
MSKYAELRIFLTNSSKNYFVDQIQIEELNTSCILQAKKMDIKPGWGVGGTEPTCKVTMLTLRTIKRSFFTISGSSKALQNIKREKAWRNQLLQRLEAEKRKYVHGESNGRTPILSRNP